MKISLGRDLNPGPFAKQQGLIYTVAENTFSNTVINRIGGLADPYNVELNNDFQDSENPVVAVSGNAVHVVWDSDSSEILYKRSIDGGASFGDIITLSDGIIDTAARIPVVSVAENDVYVVWVDEDVILLRKSTNGGASFAGPVIVSTLTIPFSVDIDMAVVGNSVYLVWSEIITGDTEDPREIFFTMSVDGGNTFSEKENLSNNNTDAISPAIAINQNQIHVVWSDRSDLSTREILYRRSLDGGQTFGAAKNLSNNPSGSLQPTVAASGDQLYVVWSDNSAGSFEILFTKSQNGGNTFDATERISNNPGDSRSPVIIASESEIYVVWVVFPGGIFFIRSVDGGITFGAATMIIPNGSDPALAVSQNIA